MSLDLDAILDRRRLKRQLAWWRTLAILAGLAAVLVAIGRFAGLDREDHVAELHVNGLIIDDPALRAALAAVGDDDTAQALIVHIDSPGGTTVGGEALYVALRRLAERKPVVAVIGTLGASAGYLVALAADHIVGRGSSLTGSIGVMLQTVEVSALLDDLGIRAEVIRSAPLKGQPSPTEPMSEAARATTQAVVDDVYDWFVGILAERRGMSGAQARGLADGRVFTGRQALSVNLIDAIGGPPAARVWLETERGVSRQLPGRDIGSDDATETILRRVLGLAEKTLLSERLMLDGLISVWHPGELR